MKKTTLKRERVKELLIRVRSRTHKSLQTLAEERSTLTALMLIERNRSLMIKEDDSDDGSTYHLTPSKCLPHLRLCSILHM